MFGGVYDNEVDDDEEQLDSEFYNDQFMLDLEKGKWYPLILNGPKGTASRNTGQSHGMSQRDMWLSG